MYKLALFFLILQNTFLKSKNQFFHFLLISPIKRLFITQQKIPTVYVQNYKVYNVNLFTVASIFYRYILS